MKIEKHIRILEFALSSLFRQKLKNIIIILAYTLNVFIFSSAIFFSESLKNEAVTLLEYSPELIVQRMRGGRHELVPLQYAEKIKEIRGVTAVTPRYWGYHYDPPVNNNYTFLGADQLPPEVLEMVEGSFYEQEGNDLCVIGQGVADARFVDTEDIIPVLGADGDLHALRVAGIFTAKSNILTNDLVILKTADLKKIFLIPDDMATDLVVKVRNVNEVSTIARKIQEMMPDSRPIEKSQIIKTYEAIFSWRGGLMVAIFFGSITAFSILAWDKATGLSGQERKDIGILKAIGWDTSDIIELKFWEGFIISSMAFFPGIIFAQAHIYLLDGLIFSPLMKGWSSIFPQINLAPQIEIYHLIVIIFLTIIPYITATLIPSWKAAITDPDMIMKG
ncbi:MAG: ABC transporter permease [Desulfurivibrionaceae bacterium]|nr:ABC transporter permease [Desulfurivibrionaceae bacterium]